MKNLLLIAILSLFSFNIYGNSDTTKVVPDTAKVTLAQVYGDAKEALSGLGQALKVGSEHVYGILVKQQIVRSIVWLVLLVVFSITTVLSTKLLIYCAKSDEDYSDVLGPFSLFACVASIIILIACICQVDVIVTGFINPQYGALKDIMDFINKK